LAKQLRMRVFLKCGDREREGERQKKVELKKIFFSTMIC
jgi:hypothetical protein